MIEISCSSFIQTMLSPVTLTWPSNKCHSGTVTISYFTYYIPYTYIHCDMKILTRYYLTLSIPKRDNHFMTSIWPSHTVNTSWIIALPYILLLLCFCLSKYVFIIGVCVCMFIYLNDRVIIYANHCHVALGMVG